MPRTKIVPTESREAARACLLDGHGEAELSALLVTAELLHRVPGFLRQLLVGIQWVGDVRARLTHIDDPPEPVRTALALGAVSSDDASGLTDMPGGRAMLAQINAGLQLAESVRRARELLPKTTMFGRGGEGPKKLLALSRMPPIDLVALVLLIATRAGFSSRFSATEATAFAVLAGFEAPTDDVERRLNTWSKRLRRMETHLNQPLVDLGRVHLQIISRRVGKLAEGEAVHAKVKAAIGAAAERVAVR